LGHGPPLALPEQEHIVGTWDLNGLVAIPSKPRTGFRLEEVVESFIWRWKRRVAVKYA
jgi:hypothetical protein